PAAIFRRSSTHRAIPRPGTSPTTTSPTRPRSGSRVQASTPGAGGITGSGGWRPARGTNARRRRTPVNATSHPSTPHRGGTSSDEGPGMRAAHSPEFLTVQGLSLRVAVEGRGQPLLLISGLGATLDVWEPLRELLPGFQTIAF